MKLKPQHIKYLRKMGYLKRDMHQIEVATSLTRYEYKGKLICDEEALDLLGTEEYLSGIARSAFHWTCVRETPSGEKIYFDTSALFR